MHSPGIHLKLSPDWRILLARPQTRDLEVYRTPLAQLREQFRRKVRICGHAECTVDAVRPGAAPSEFIRGAEDGGIGGKVRVRGVYRLP